jgi:SAM-dependent methyltransferase
VSVLGRVRSRVTGLLPYRVRRRLRALLERPVADPDDVAHVAALTAAHWRDHVSPRYVQAYWDDADGGGASTGTRRSEWLVGLPPLRRAQSVLELGCGPGRNLWVLQRRHPATALFGIDISAEGIAHARQRVRGEFLVGDLYRLDELLRGRRVDVIFTMGVLIHLHPQALPPLLQVMRGHARQALVFVEQVSATNEIVKGPARWGPSRRVTGDYIQWSPDLPRMLRALGLEVEQSAVPLELQSNGARDLLVVRP